MAGDDERIRKYETEIARLDALYADLERLWSQVPRLGYLALVAPAVWAYAGLGWGIVALLVAASLVGTQAYLIGVRKSENRWNRAHVADDLARLRHDLSRPT